MSGYTKNRMIRILSIFFLLISGAMGPVLYSGDYIIALINLLTIGMSLFNLLYIRRRPYSEVPANITVGVSTIVVCLILWARHTSESIIIWSLIFPTMSVYFVGFKRAAATNLVILAMAAFDFFLFHPVKGGAPYTFALRYLGAYFLLFVVSSSLEKVRKTIISNLQSMAYSDPLTGLSNRIDLLRQLKRLTDSRNQKNKPFTVYLINLDNFRSINATLGTAEGDKVLQRISIELRFLFPHALNIARTSADEFTVLQRDQSKEEAETNASTINERLEEIARSWPEHIHLSASIGLAFYPYDEENANDLLGAAQLAREEAKKQGRSRACSYFTSLGEGLKRRHQIEQAIHSLQKDDELRLEYQPQVNISSGQVVSAEALLRWRHPELGNVSPDEFIPIAEETGAILELGDWVIEKSIETQREIIDKTSSPLPISINLSPRQFLQKGFLDRFLKKVKEKNLEPEFFEMEVTENFIMKNPKEVSAMIAEYRGVGLRFALDDFGAGYAGLQYLKDFMVDTIKIDRSYIQEIPGKETTARIVKLIQMYALQFGIRTIAEGVETQEELDAVKQIGVEIVQGFYYYRSLERDRLLQLLSHSADNKA